MQILNNIQKIRWEQNISLRELSKLSGVSHTEIDMIENGKITYPVKGATLIGSGPAAMGQISMIGNDLELDSGVGTCGTEGQSVPVGVGMPTLKMTGLTVGGTA